jgi:hypothetical protein
MTDGFVIVIMVVVPIVDYAIYADSAPPQNYFAATTQVERLYKENGQVLVYPILDPAAASAACPNGSQVARESTRVDGAREYLIWDLRCR